VVGGGGDDGRGQGSSWMAGKSGEVGVEVEEEEEERLEVRLMRAPKDPSIILETGERGGGRDLSE